MSSTCTLWSGQLASVRLGVELAEEFSEMLTSGHDKAAAIPNTQQLWLSAQDPLPSPKAWKQKGTSWKGGG